MRPEAVDVTLCNQIEASNFDSTNVYENGDVVAFRYEGNEEPTKQNVGNIDWKGTVMKVSKSSWSEIWHKLRTRTIFPENE